MWMARSTRRSWIPVLMLLALKNLGDEKGAGMITKQGLANVLGDTGVEDGGMV